MKVQGHPSRLDASESRSSFPSTTHLDSAPSLSMTKRPIETIVLDDSDDERDPVGDQDEFEAQLARAIALSKRESDHAGSSSSTQVKGDTSE